MWERTSVPGIYKRAGARGRLYRVMYRDAAGKQRVRNFKRWEDAKEHKRTNTGLERPDEAVDAGRRTLAELYRAQTDAREYAAESLSVRAAAWRYLEPLADAPLARFGPTLVEEILRTYYNGVRPHRAIGRRTPAEAFAARPKATPRLPGFVVPTQFRVRRDRSTSPARSRFATTGGFTTSGWGVGSSAPGCSCSWPTSTSGC
jgi:hypothetical protein